MTFDLRGLTAEFYADPYPSYREMLRKGRVLPLADGGYFVTRHADLHEIYRNPGTFSSDKRVQFGPVFGENSNLFEHHTTSLVFNDPPLHTHVRKAIGNALSQRVVQLLQTNLRKIVDALLDLLEDMEEVDLIGDYASAIPVEIIGDLLGVPKDERAPLRDWSLAILGSLEVDLSPEQQARGERCVIEFVEYLKDLIKRRSKGAAHPRDDIISRLMNWELDGQRLTARELYHQCIFLLNAGHETTTNLIGNGIELLLRYPEELEKLRAHPQLIDTGVEEMLRFESPNQLGNRTTTQLVRIGDHEIRKGSILTLCIGAANRDPKVFDDPDVFDISRAPNPHLAFGSGIHTCAGLNVARLEGQVAIQQFFTRFTQVGWRTEPQRAKRARFRGFEHLSAKVAR